MLIRSLLLAGAFLLQAEPRATLPRAPDAISGRHRPECIPRSIATEYAFREINQVAWRRPGVRHEEGIQGLQRHTLRMARADLLTLADVAAASLESAESLRRPLEEEHTRGKHLSWSLDQRKRRIADAYRVFLSAYDQLRTTLSPAGLQVFNEWLADGVVPTIEVQAQWLPFVPDGDCHSQP